MLVVIASLDRLCAARISARVRRAWWLLVPLAFLVTVPVPVLPAAKPIAAQPVKSRGAVALSVELMTRPAGQVAANAPMRWPRASWALAIVLSGSTLYLLNALARTCAALRRFRGLPLCTDPALLLVLEECQARAGVTFRVGLVVSERVPAPLVLGWLRPRILLPGAVIASLSREQLRGVLFHELAHLRAQDVPCTFLFALVCALHWFNPAAHLALRGWTQVREEAADEIAIGWLGASSHLAYGETLLCVLRAASEPHQTSPATLAVVGSVNQLRKRLLMIKQHSSKSSHRLVAVGVFVVAAAVLLHPVRATIPDEAPTVTPSSSEAKAITVSPPTDLKGLAVQVAGTTVAILPGNATNSMNITGDSLTATFPKEKTTEWNGKVTLVEATSVTRNSFVTVTYKGKVEAQITAPGHSPVTLAGNDLVFTPQDLASSDETKTIRSFNLSTSTEDQSRPVSLEIQFGGATAAFIPTKTLKGGLTLSFPQGFAKGMTLDTKTQVETCSGQGTMVVNLAGQPAITISGEDLTIIPHY